MQAPSRRLLVRLLVLTLASAAIGVVLPARPAAAQPTFSNAPRLSWVYTESPNRRPRPARPSR